MWSGTTLTNFSGSIIGTHQKVDRVAAKYLRKLVKNPDDFPKTRDILHFEGKNGPDGIKSKSPAKDEPIHFYDPFDEGDSELLGHMEHHYKELVKQLKKGSPERAAFDAAWLAHTVVDGLTPAHQYPYEQKLFEIRGESIETRDSIMKKVFMPGDTVTEKFKNNWEMYGIKGLLSMHGWFEFGAGLLLAPVSLKKGRPTESDLELLADLGYVEIFKRSAREVALLEMYERLHKTGWTPRLARDVRNKLGPIMVKTVALVWYSAMRDAGLLRGKK